MGKPAHISSQQLIDFSGEHLYYEIKMLFGVRALLKKGVQDQYVYSALLESFIIHTNIILDFFYKPQTKPDDAKAAHYIRDLIGWKRDLPAYEGYFRKFNRRRSREVVHLSYKRLETKGNEKLWSIEKTTDHIKRLIVLFLDKADPALLHPKIYELKRAL